MPTKKDAEKSEILWVDDDIWDIEGLIYDVKSNNTLTIYDNLTDATIEIEKEPNKFDLLIVDMIMPPMNAQGKKPLWFKQQASNGENGIGLIRYIRNELRLNTPILILSISNNPIQLHNLEDFQNIFFMKKMNLGPSIVDEKVTEVLKLNKETIKTISKG